MQGTSGMHQACATAGGLAAVATMLVTLYTTVLPARANDAILPPLPAAEGGGGVGEYPEDLLDGVIRAISPW